MSLRRSVARRFGWLLQHRFNTGSYFYGDLHLISAGEKFANRWNDIAQVGDFRPGDEILDVGCAEGLISLEVSKMVARVRGIDIDANRIERANFEAKKRNAANASFQVGSVIDFPLQPLSFDLILFLSVFGKHNTGRVGMRELRRLLDATRRQIIVRANVQTSNEGGALLSGILSTMNEAGFDGFCFPAPPRGATNLIIGNRRETDACVRAAPAFVLLPSENLRRFPSFKDTRISAGKLWLGSRDN